MNKMTQEKLEATKQFFDLSTYLTLDLIEPSLQGINKEEIIDELLDLICKTGAVKNREKAKEAILIREKEMSTGLQNGIAIPYGKTDAVDRLICAIGIKKDGVYFNSLDGKPSNIFIITLSPKKTSSPHVQLMSSISQILSLKNRNILLQTESKKKILDIFTNKNHKSKQQQNKANVSKEAKELANQQVKKEKYELKKYLTEDCINTDLKGSTKEDVIEELLNILNKTKKINNINKARLEIWNREKLISTGLANGIAIPHAKSGVVKDLVCAIGLSKKGIDFETMDKKPVHIIILTLSPKDMPVPYIQFMSMLIKSFMSVDINKLLSIDNKKNVREFIINSFFLD